MSAAYTMRSWRADKTANGLFMGIDGLDEWAIVISFGDSTEREGWGHDQIRAIKRLASRMRQSARVRRAMADAEALGAALAKPLENRRLGIIQLDRQGRILEANDRARDILSQHDGLCDAGGVPSARHHGENEELERLLAQVPPRVGGAGRFANVHSGTRGSFAGFQAAYLNRRAGLRAERDS
ncbi:hypothetical protein [Candidatus Palauibacter sp.]|uniref:hypothetical protein n=1 Tax=Candidatus Palauibacter sp. TaxID=3101350 RepID=UPI003AF21644